MALEGVIDEQRVKVVESRLRTASISLIRVSDHTLETGKKDLSSLEVAKEARRVAVGTWIRVGGMEGEDFSEYDGIFFGPDEILYKRSEAESFKLPKLLLLAYGEVKQKYQEKGWV